MLTEAWASNACGRQLPRRVSLLVHAHMHAARAMLACGGVAWLQARVGRSKERSGHPAQRAVAGVAKALRSQMVSGTAQGGPEVLAGI